MPTVSPRNTRTHSCTEASNATEAVAFLERLFGFRIMDPEVFVISRIPSELRWSNVWTVSVAALSVTALAGILRHRKAVNNWIAAASRIQQLVARRASELGGDLVRLLDTVSGLLRDFPTALEAGPGSHLARAFETQAEEASRLRNAIAANPEAVSLGSATQEWVQLGSVLADLDRIRRELSGAVALPMGTAPVLPSAPTS